jgi:hypothetical protein
VWPRKNEKRTRPSRTGGGAFFGFTGRAETGRPARPPHPSSRLSEEAAALLACFVLAAGYSTT